MRRLFARAAFVVGGAVAGTAAAWALSGAGASASEAPDAPSTPDAVVQSATHAVPDTGKLTGPIGEQLSEASDNATQALHEATGQASDAAGSASKHVAQHSDLAQQRGEAAGSPAQLPDFEGVRQGVEHTVDIAGKKLRDGLHDAGQDLKDGLGRPLGPITEPLQPVTEPLDPITKPVPGLDDPQPPAADFPTPVEPPGASGVAGASVPAPTHPQPVLAQQPNPAPAAPIAASDTYRHYLPAGGLPGGTGSPDEQRNYIPLELPVGTGSAGHDSSSSVSHGPLLGAHLGLPVLPDPAQRGVLIPDADRLNVNLADQPGTTPD